MKPLHIVLVMIEPPLPFGNAAARWYYVLLRGLVERGHQVTALATCSKPGEVEEAERLFPRPRYNLRCYPHPGRGGLGAKIETLRRPYSYMFSKELKRDLIAALSARFDVLHLEQLWSGWLGMKHADRAVINTHYLFAIDQAGTPSPGFSLAWLRSKHAVLAERRLLRSYNRQLAVTDRLRDRIRSTNPGAEIAVVPIGIDLHLYPFDPLPARSPSAPPTVGLIGSFDWTPTVSAARHLVLDLWPRICQHVPNARLLLVGRGADAALGEFREKIAGLEIRSDVVESIPHFRDLDVLLYAPAAGSGMKVKIIEAMALGTPVVTNSSGSEGLDPRDGIEAGVSNDDGGLVDRTVFLLRDRIRRSSMAEAARALVEKLCDESAVLDRLEYVYRQMTSSGAAYSSVSPMPIRQVEGLL